MIFCELVPFVIYNKVKIKDFFPYWLENVIKVSCSNNTYNSYTNIINNHLITELGDKNINLLTPMDIQRFYKKKVEFSHDITKLCKVVIDTGLDFAKKKHIINRNVARDVSLPKQIAKKNIEKEK